MSESLRLRRTNLLVLLSLVLSAAILGGCAGLGQTDGRAVGAGEPSAHTGGNESAPAPEPAPTSESAPGQEPAESPSPTTPPPPTKVVMLDAHPLLQNPDFGLPNNGCTLPEWGTSEKQIEKFFRAASKCLDRSWSKLLRAHNLPFNPPTLHFPKSKEFSTDCGTQTVGVATAAYYCEGELFLPPKGLQINDYTNSAGVYLALIAHEYGHHVQELAGIMDAAWNEIYDKGQDSAPGKEMSRRKELQAQCFSGMFLGSTVDRGGSVDQKMYKDAWDDQERRGDGTSGQNLHGSNAHYAKWWRLGAKDNRIAKCNTFKASKNEVS